MTFRKGGRIAENEHIKLRGKNLEIVQTFKYLGIMLQTSGSSYRIHVREKASAAIRATYSIKDLPYRDSH